MNTPLENNMIETIKILSDIRYKINLDFGDSISSTVYFEVGRGTLIRGASIFASLVNESVVRILAAVILFAGVITAQADTPDTFKVPPEFGRKFEYIPSFESFYNKNKSDVDTSCWGSSSPLWLLRNPSLLVAVPAPVTFSNYVTVINTSANTDPKETKIESDMKPIVKKVGDKWVITFKK